jgi:hypothetical protein
MFYPATVKHVRHLQGINAGQRRRLYDVQFDDDGSEGTGMRHTEMWELRETICGFSVQVTQQLWCDAARVDWDLPTTCRRVLLSRH